VSDHADELALAIALADRADAITFPRFRAEDLDVETKDDATPVSEADRAAEQAIREHLERLRPGDAVLGEEYGDDGGSERRWIVDPIDGTKNYVGGVPVWATLVAFAEAEEVVVGVASAPALGRRWWASRDGGAWVHDRVNDETRRLRVSDVAELSDAEVGLAGGLEDWPRREALLAVADRVRRSRMFGDFWQYMLVAEGALEAAVDPAAALWDLAAVQIIVEEAGGRFTDLGGRRTADGGHALATNGHLHDSLLKLLA
jgi:histidinol-phosphatase